MAKMIQIPEYLIESIDPSELIAACDERKLAALIAGLPLHELQDLLEPTPTVPGKVPPVPAVQRVLCNSCNSAKRARTFGEWRPELEARVRAAVRAPLTAELRAEGRRLAELARPGRLAAKRLRDARRRDPSVQAARVAALAEVPF